MSERDSPRKFDEYTRDAAEDLQRQVAQETGDVPPVPLVTYPLGHVVELVEEEFRNVDDPKPVNKGEK